MAGPGVLSAGAQLLSRHRTACLCAAGLCLSLAAAWLWRKGSRRSKRKLQQVGVVSQLFIYPVKSFRGISLQEAECTELGLKHGALRDRHWGVIKEDGHMVSGRQEPKLVLGSVSSEGGFITLSAPDMEKLCLPLKLPRANPVWNCRMLGHAVQGKDCGDEAAKWINAYLKRSEPYRLVQFESNMKLRDSITEFVLYTRDDKTAYSDLSPILLLSQASLDDLNSKLDKKVKMQNFRPCIVVSGCSAFDEGVGAVYPAVTRPPSTGIETVLNACLSDFRIWTDDGGVCILNLIDVSLTINIVDHFEDSWDDILIGKAELIRVMPCPRCIFTTVDPDTGVADIKEPLNTLRSYRMCQTKDKKYYDGPAPLNKSPLFGQFYGVERIGTVKVGDPVYKIVS